MRKLFKDFFDTEYKMVRCAARGCWQEMNEYLCGYINGKPYCVEHMNQIRGFIKDEKLQATERTWPIRSLFSMLKRFFLWIWNLIRPEAYFNPVHATLTDTNHRTWNIIKITSGKRHAWVDAGWGLIRKPLGN